MLSDDSLWGTIWVLPYVKRDPGLAWVVELGTGEEGNDDDQIASGEGKGVVGYIVGTDDTAAFDEYFANEWWPSKRGAFVRSEDAGVDVNSISTDEIAVASSSASPSTSSRRNPTREREIIQYAETKGRDPSATDLAPSVTTLPSQSASQSQSQSQSQSPTSPTSPTSPSSFTTTSTSSTPLQTKFPAHLHIDLLPIAQRRRLGPQLISLLFNELSARGVRGVHLGASASNTAACRFYERTGFDEVRGRKEGSRVFVWDLTGERMVV